MRKLIAGMKMSIDGKVEGPEGFADWVEAWSNDYDLTGQIDACVLGAGMYPGYEKYWSAIQSAPDQPLPMTGKLPTPAEVEWSRFTKTAPHYVLSNTLNSALWANTRFIRDPSGISALKQQSGKDLYLVGGARITASLIDAGLVDELRLIVYPLIAGKGKQLFAISELRRVLELRKVQQLAGGRVSLNYRIN
ncbi:MAG TPA: dihydrofolate reductase family protein [Chloroflexota bacterium]